VNQDIRLAQRRRGAENTVGMKENDIPKDLCASAPLRENPPLITAKNLTFSIATPVFNGMPWLPLCIASVRDQVASVGGNREIGDGRWKMGGEESVASSTTRNLQPATPNSTLSVEHIVQDGGSPDIEEFARTVGADFHRNGELAFSGSEVGSWQMGDGAQISHSSHLPSPSPQGENLPSSSPQGDNLPSPAAAGGSHRLVIHSGPDGGMYDAINRAWRRCQGEVISYLNADEQYLPDTLHEVGDYFQKNPDVDIVFGDALLIDRAGRALSYRRVVKPWPAHTRVVHLGTLSCSMFFRRRLLDDGYFFDPRWKAIGDAEWVWRLLKAGVSTGVISKPLAAFTMTGNNMGENPSALAEAADWREGSPRWQRAASPLLRGIHWLRKAGAGAYRRHKVNTAVYTCDSPGKRVPILHQALGSAWPG